jgi:DNA-binding phage protein
MFETKIAEMTQETIRRNELLVLDADLKQQLKKAVKAKSKTKIADDMGVSRSTLDRLLKGKGNAISIQKVRQFLEAA